MYIPDNETIAKVEVLADLEQDVADLTVAHEAKRILWFPSELLAPEPDTDPDAFVKQLRERAKGISMPARVVAPTSVNGGRSSLTERAAGPSPIMMSIWKSSSAG